MKRACGMRWFVLFGSLLHLGAQAACNPPPSGLVSWWRAESNAFDETGLNSGNLVSRVALGAGEVGKAFLFNGTNSYIRVLYSTTLASPTYSVEAWVNPSGQVNNSVGQAFIFGQPFAQAQMTLRTGTSGVVPVFQFGTGDAFTYVAAVSTNEIPTNQFSHLVGTWDGSNLRLYVNGVLRAEMPTELRPGDTQCPFFIGGLNSIGTCDYVGQFFNGAIDELTYYGRALTEPEVTSLFTAGSAGKCPLIQPPLIFTQPSDQAVSEGETAFFTVTATGTLPLSYQWQRDGVYLAGQTDPSLTLTNVQAGDAGVYSVLLTNPNGSTLSSGAVLMVTPATTCTPLPPGLVGWWHGENDTADAAGANNATLVNNASFGAGKVGQAFNFEPFNSAYAQAPDSDLWAFGTNDFSIELWVKFRTWSPSGVYYLPEAVFAANDEEPEGRNRWVFGLGDGKLELIVTSPVFGSLFLIQAPFTPTPNQWYHLALVRDGNLFTAYTNGLAAGSEISSVVIPNPKAPLTMGQAEGLGYIDGLLDEISIYRRALSQSELQAIYGAGSAGKCVVPLPAFIGSQPANVVTTVGSTATFSVGAAGTAPLSYQWSRNGTPIEGATTAALTLTNVQAAQAGTYAVVVTNAWGSATSSNATLTVNFPTALVKVTSVTAPAAGVPVTVPVTLVANGNENALSFSLTFDPARLTFKEALAGSAVEAGPLVNSLQAASGRVGIAVCLAPNVTFPTGTQEVVRVVFTPALRNIPTTSTIGFGDLPTKRQLSDVQVVALPANFVFGTVTTPAARYEGDVSPRPNGDQAVTITDWVLAGRYAARLDYPTNAAEFQRADCAPLISAGDGLLTVSDWVQAGLFAAGLDPLAPIGGPTNETVISGIPPALKSPGPKDASSGRVVRVYGGMSLQDQPVNASVALEALGGENGLGFSVSFDASKLTYTGATLDSGATGATLNINAAEAVAGRLGFALTLGTSRSFAAGTSSVVRLTFQPKPSVTGTFPLALGNQPVVREVCDTNAVVCPTTFADGAVVVNPYPSLRLSKAPTDGLTLAWPRWATNFVVQETGGPAGISDKWTNLVVTPTVVGDENVVTLPITGETKFYRLQGQ